MTDRELLEKAAKAAGYTLHAGLMKQRASAAPDAIALALSEPGNTWWNPLEDDGDALRLAVKLRLEIVPIEGGGVDVERTTEQEPFGELLATESGLDPYACTRRAIVRAAAGLAGD